MFVLTRVYNCTCVCIMCLDNSFGVSTMNNTMYLYYVLSRDWKAKISSKGAILIQLVLYHEFMLRH